jgi:hypothetical protein
VLLDVGEIKLLRCVVIKDAGDENGIAAQTVGLHQRGDAWI